MSARMVPRVATLLVALVTQPVLAQAVEIYGSAQGDAIGDFKTNDPSWFDVNRPSKLPSFPEGVRPQRKLAKLL